jgi:RNA polymerase sigma factor (sigma-70 family)
LQRIARQWHLEGVGVDVPADSHPVEPATLSADDRFAAFYRDAYPWAKRLAHLLLGGGADAEDVVQDAFTHVHARFADVLVPDAYLRTSVVNGCRQLHRGRVREDRRIRLVADHGERVVDIPDPLLDAVATLPLPQRAALVLRYWSDLHDDDIAAALGVRPATVRSLVHRGLTALRKEIDRC